MKKPKEAPEIKVQARCKCEPYRLIMLSLGNRLADLTCPECGEVAIHIDIEWPED
jgi:predicted RNA-binding Zn-ribbon protein involved in translation (DUF1610 family)